MQDKKFFYIALTIIAVIAAAVYQMYSTGFFEKRDAETPGIKDRAAGEDIDLVGLGLEIGETVTKDGYTIERLPDAEAAFDFDRTIPSSGGHIEGDARVQAATNLKALTANLKANPDQFTAWLSVGVYRLILGDPQGAILAWEYTAKLYPSAWEPHVNLGNYYRDNGDSAKAKAAYAIALQRAESTGNAELTAGIQKELDSVK